LAAVNVDGAEPWFEFRVIQTGELVTLDGRSAAGIRRPESPTVDWKLIRYSRDIPPVWRPELADRAAFPASADTAAFPGPATPG
jgi:hypothetical protein